ncbi:MAG: hypothetical protein DME59_14870 [Verrucomicrobia bacterium]|nr:MAG: hypothetical protein DME59_14870 [Verrucomicrobiota bacterium]PYL78180.1 MAG: hypothetical protein DMF26_01565 [Verrucomicrobiota bacterium]
MTRIKEGRFSQAPEIVASRGNRDPGSIWVAAVPALHLPVFRVFWRLPGAVVVQRRRVFWRIPLRLPLRRIPLLR